MTHLRRKFSLMMVLAIALMSLSACGGEPTATPPAAATNTVGTTTGTEGTATTGTEASTPGATTTTSGATTPGTTGTTTTGGGMTLPASCSAVSINYWNSFSGPDGQVMQKMVDEFNAANPNIKVNSNTTQGVSGDYDTQLDTAQASGNLPEVAIINEDKVATRAYRNTLRPLDDMMTNWGIDASDYPAVAWDTGATAGKRYGIPLSFVAMTMYYNNDMLKAAGMTSPPTNKEDFEKAAQAMTANGKNGFLITTAFPVQQIFQQLLHQFGGSEFSADGTKATWNSDAGVQALTWMKEANDKYGQPNLEVDAELNAFKAGNVGMIWNGIWQLSSVTGTGVSFDGKAAAPPQIGSQPAVWAGGTFLTMPTQKNPDECKDAASGIFIKYLVDNSIEWATAGNIPASNKARNSSEFQAMPQAVLAKAVENPVFPPPIPGIGDAFAPLGNAVGSVMAGTQTDIKKALDDSAAQSDTILAENRSKFGTAPGGGTGTTGATPAATTGTGGTGGGATPESTMTEGTGATPGSTGTAMEATPEGTTTGTGGGATPGSTTTP